MRAVRFYTSTYPERRPKGLTIYGTNGDPNSSTVVWNELTAYSDLNLAIGKWTDYLIFENETSYRAYRIRIADNMGGDQWGKFLNLWEMELVSLPPPPGMTPVTSGVAGGELRFDIPAGKEAVISGMLLSGGLKVVKDGAGTLVASKDVSYTGGTEIAAGILKLDALSASKTPLGSYDSIITVSAGSTLDLNGAKCMGNYELTLAGGTLQNSGADKAEVGNLVLTDDSKINYPDVGASKNDISVVGNTEWNLGGHQLTIAFGGSDPDLYFTASNVKIYNGTVKTTANGYFLDNIGVDASDRVTYDFSSSLRLRGSASVSNFICRTTSNSVCSRTDDNVPRYLTLSGTFTPLSKYCYNMRLLNGATIDLSSYDTAWQLECRVDYGGYYDTRTEFADGATIKVDLGTRRFTEGTKVITWTTPPANLSSLRFRSANRQCRMVVDSTGVWAFPNGFVLFVR